MNKIIVTDIFGKTPAVIALAKAINAETIVEPYDSKNMAFANETEAYQYFTENIGLDAYQNKLSKIIQECDEDTILIGFSVGASVIWQLSALISVNQAKHIKSAICFYGSQIRHLIELFPKFGIKLIFPKSEPHFDVVALRKVIANKPRVTTIQVDYLHGFMNYHSSNFNQAGYEEHMKSL